MMRLALFDKGRLGIVDGDTITDVTDQVTRSSAGPAGVLQQYIEALSDASGPVLDPADGRRVALADVQLEAPLPRPGKIIGAPVNYLDHKAEMDYPTSIADLGVFLKANSSVIGPDQDIVLPYSDVRTDQEGELAVVIGRTASHVSADDALDHVFGYTCLLDITVRSGEDRIRDRAHGPPEPPERWSSGGAEDVRELLP
ncbi:fumarylacetoacetate hydrolase family protein, partial [Streptomyces roseolus]|uniref:fumarylacetoacetate hydrolase family protein n=1 Tax=Streptomyces roseolus TaxID=67358 RepID=UPI0036518946